MITECVEIVEQNVGEIVSALTKDTVSSSTFVTSIVFLSGKKTIVLGPWPPDFIRSTTVSVAGSMTVISSETSLDTNMRRLSGVSGQGEFDPMHR